MWKPIKQAEIISVTYDTDKGQGLMDPDTVWDKTYCNDLDTEQMSVQEKHELAITSGTDSCFSLEESLQITEKISVSAEIPEVAKVGEETSITMGAKATQQLCIKESKTETESQTFGPDKLEPLASKKLTLSQTKSTVKQLPFSAQMAITFDDNDTYYRKVSGTFEGVQVTKTRESWGNYHAVKPGDCSN